MKIKELLVEYPISKEKQSEQVDEFIQVLAPIAGAVGRGIAMAGQAAARGLSAVGKGVTGAARAVTPAVQKAAQSTSNVVRTVGTNAAKAIQATQAQSTQQDKENIKKSLDSLKSNLQSAGGGNIDTAKAADALSKLKPGQPVDPSLTQILPAIANILTTQQTASSLGKAASSVGKLMSQSQVASEE